jgi:hypothetical protein
MTPKLIDREVVISSILKLDPNIKTPDKNVYTKLAKAGKDVNAYKDEPLQQLPFTGIEYIGNYKKYDLECFEDNGQFYDLNDVEKKRLLLDATQDFFGLTFIDQKLLYGIADETYLHSVIGIGDEETDYIQQKYLKWIEGCKIIDSIKPYINTMHPDFDKRQKIYREQFEELSKKVPNVWFFQVLNAFFIKYKSLNKITESKIDELLLLGLPNIDRKNASKIVEMVNYQK